LYLLRTQFANASMHIYQQVLVKQKEDGLESILRT
jgi:hypothetical protein